MSTDTPDHAAEARKHIDWAHEQQGEEGTFDETVLHNATLAVAEATLALVEEQRTANLIAAMSLTFPENALITEQWNDVRDQIAERLGLA